MPIRLVICILKEVQRANKVHYGVLFAMKNFPGSHIVVAAFGILKGISLNTVDPVLFFSHPLATPWT